jgi:hypothetical protein
MSHSNLEIRRFITTPAFFTVEIRDRQRDARACFMRHHNDESAWLCNPRPRWMMDHQRAGELAEVPSAGNLEACPLDRLSHRHRPARGAHDDCDDTSRPVVALI